MHWDVLATRKREVVVAESISWPQSHEPPPLVPLCPPHQESDMVLKLRVAQIFQIPHFFLPLPCNLFLNANEKMVPILKIL